MMTGRYVFLQFDPLLVESHQAGTVVLMLSSPEEEVLAKACEAIYKFVDKCEWQFLVPPQVEDNLNSVIPG